MGVLARADVLDVEIGSAVVVYDPVAGRAHLLNDTGALVWHRCGALGSIDAVVADVVAQFPDRADVVERDVRAAVARFDERGLLGEAPLAPSPHPQVADAPGWVARDEPATWPTTRSFRVVGQQLAFRCSEPELVVAIDLVLDPLAVDGAPTTWFDIGPGADGTTDVWRADHHVQTHRHVEMVVESLPYLLNRIATDTVDAVVLHAAGIGTGGHAVALPAQPDAGKSTLVAAFVRRGATYLSDEAIGIGLGSRAVEPYPKRISLDADSVRAIDGFAPAGAPAADDRWHVDPRELHPDALITTHAPHSLARCVFPSYRPGAVANLEALSPVDAFLALVSNTFNLRATGQRGLATLAQVAQEVPCHRLEHGDVGPAVEAVDALVRQT